MQPGTRLAGKMAHVSAWNTTLMPLALVALAMFTLGGPEQNTAYADTVSAIRAEHHGCPKCVLSGADLSNQCLQGANFTGADLDHARLVLTCLSGANLKGASLRRADLSGANFLHADFGSADLTGAVFSATSIKGAQLKHAKGLTQQQIDAACGDAETELPPGLTVKLCQ